MPTDFLFLFMIRVVVVVVFIIRVYPIQFYFIFIFLFDPSWSESIRVDPTGTGGPSRSGPTFVPAYLKVHIQPKQIFDVFSFLWLLSSSTLLCLFDTKNLSLF